MFERFSRASARSDVSAEWLSVQGNGSISISFAALKKIGMPNAVFLLWDKNSKRIGIEAAPEDHPEAYPARLQGRRNNPKGARVVSASAFFKYIGLDAKTAVGRYPVTFEDKMIVAQMNPDHFTE